MDDKKGLGGKAELSDDEDITSGAAAGAAATAAEAALSLPSSVVPVPEIEVPEADPEADCVFEWLRTYYQRQRYLPVPTTHSGASSQFEIDRCFVQLALVETETTEANAASTAALEGEASLASDAAEKTLYQNRMLLLPEQVFDTVSGTAAVNKVLVTGRAGVGKTTLCQYLAYSWANGEGLAGFASIVWLPLRSLPRYLESSAAEKSLAGWIKFACHVDAATAKHKLPSQAEIESVLRRRSDKLLFLLDGWDEVAHLLQEGGTAAKLLEAALELPRILVTSRPYQVNCQIKFDRTVENIGFTEVGVQRYIEVSYAQEADLDSKMLTRLIRRHPLLRQISFIPLNLFLLCQLYRDDPADLEHTQMNLTDIYRKLFAVISRRRTADGTVSKPDEAALEKLRQLAFTQLRATKDVATGAVGSVEFDAKFIETTILSDTTITVANLVDTGLLRQIDQHRYSFFHLTFQEYLAAEYLIEQTHPDKQGTDSFKEALQFIEQQKYHPRYQVMFQFLWGLSLEKEAPHVAYLLDAFLSSEVDWVGLRAMEGIMPMLDYLSAHPALHTQGPLLQQQLFAWLDIALNTDHDYSALVEERLSRALIMAPQVAQSYLAHLDAKTDVPAAEQERALVVYRLPLLSILPDHIQGIMDYLGKLDTADDTETLTRILEQLPWTVLSEASSAVQKALCNFLLTCLQSDTHSILLKVAALTGLGYVSSKEDTASVDALTASVYSASSGAAAAAKGAGVAEQEQLFNQHLAITLTQLKVDASAEALPLEITILIDILSNEDPAQAHLGYLGCTRLLALQTQQQTMLTRLCETLTLATLTPEQARQVATLIIPYLPLLDAEQQALIRDAARVATTVLYEDMPFTLDATHPITQARIQALLDAEQHPDPEIQQAAVKGLGRLGCWTAEIEKRLLARMQDAKAEKQARTTAVEAVGQLYPVSVTIVRALISIVEKWGSKQLRHAAKWALGTLKAPGIAVEPVLLRALAPGNDDRRSAAINALSTLEAPSAAVESTLLVALARVNKYKVQRAAANVLGILKAPTAVVESALVKALSPENAGKAIDAAANALANLKAPSIAVEPILLEMLLLDDHSVVAGAKALGTLKAPSTAVLPALLATLTQGSNDRVRNAALDALTNLRAPSAAMEPALLALSNWNFDKSITEEFRRTASAYLDPAYIMESLESNYISLKKTFARALSRLETPSSAMEQTLLTALTLENNNLLSSTAAAKALCCLKTPSAAVEPALLKALTSSNDDLLRGAAAKALGKLKAPSPDVESALLKALVPKNPEWVRYSAAKALGNLKVSSPAVEAPLIAALAPGDCDFLGFDAARAQGDIRTLLRGAAAKALGNLQSPSAAVEPALLAVLAPDNNLWVRDAAAEAFAKKTRSLIYIERLANDLNTGTVDFWHDEGWQNALRIAAGILESTLRSARQQMPQWIYLPSLVYHRLQQVVTQFTCAGSASAAAAGSSSDTDFRQVYLDALTVLSSPRCVVLTERLDSQEMQRLIFELQRSQFQDKTSLSQLRTHYHNDPGHLINLLLQCYIDSVGLRPIVTEVISILGITFRSLIANIRSSLAPASGGASAAAAAAGAMAEDKLILLFPLLISLATSSGMSIHSDSDGEVIFFSAADSCHLSLSPAVLHQLMSMIATHCQEAKLPTGYASDLIAKAPMPRHRQVGGHRFFQPAFKEIFALVPVMTRNRAYFKGTKSLLPRLDTVSRLQQNTAHDNYTLSSFQLNKGSEHLARIALKHEGGIDKLATLAQAFEHDIVGADTPWHGLDLQANGLGDDEVSLLCQLLAQYPHLHYLRLSHNHITQMGFELLLTTLAAHPSVKYLWLDNNWIYSSPAFMSRSLPRLIEKASLAHVDLSVNYIPQGKALDKGVLADAETMDAQVGKAAQQSNLRLLLDSSSIHSHHAGAGIQSLLNPSRDPTKQLHAKNAMLSIMAYPVAEGGHAFMVLERFHNTITVAGAEGSNGGAAGAAAAAAGGSDQAFAQRELIFIELRANERAEVFIRILQHSPEKLLRKTKDVNSEFTRHLLLNESQCSRLLDGVYKSRDQEALYSYQLLPSMGKHGYYNCMKWVTAQLQAIGIETSLLNLPTHDRCAVS